MSIILFSAVIINMLGRVGPGLTAAYGVPHGQQIAEVDEDEFEDLQLYPFDEPTVEDVMWMAQLIGIHPIRDKQYMYLAQEALINPPNDEWMIFKDIAGNVIWINDITEEMEPHPPHLPELMENFQRVKQKQSAMNSRNGSSDKSNAMKKILGRNLSSTDPPPIDTPLSNSIIDKRQSRLPQKNAAPPTPPTPPAPVETRASSQTTGGRGKGGGMSLLKALQHAQAPVCESKSKQSSSKSADDDKMMADDESSNNLDDADSDEKGVLVNEDYIEESDGILEQSSVEQDDSSEHVEVVQEAMPRPSRDQPASRQSGQQSKAKPQRPATAKIESTASVGQKKSANDQSLKQGRRDDKSAGVDSRDKRCSQDNKKTDDVESKQMLSKLMREVQEMQLKMSKIEEENSELRKKTTEINQKNRDDEKREPQNLRQSVEPAESNIKDGIAEIKKLLEKSILIQNEKSGSYERNLEENKSVVIPMVDYSRPSEYMRATLGGHHIGTTSQEQSATELYRPSTSMANQQRSTEFDSKWATIIMREKESLGTTRLSLHHAKLSLESRKLSIKRHEFEMKKELDTLKLPPGHPLAFKIRSNLSEQLATFRSECSAWQAKCQKLVVKQKHLSLLEKSYQFTRNNGVLERESDKHLEELFEIYRDSGTEELREDAERELGFPIDGDGLSLDTQPLDFESEQHQHDMSNCKSDKHSSAEFIQKATASNFEPSEFNYNAADVRQSLAATRYTTSNDTGRDSIRQYFSNQHKFYDSMRREVV